MDVAEIIRAALAERRYSQNEISTMINIRQSTFAERLARKNGIKVSSALEMLNALGYDLVVIPRESRAARDCWRITPPNKD